MIEIIEEIAQYKVNKNYQMDKPKGVRGRSSDNSLIYQKLGWKPSLSLKQGLTKTYKWIENQLVNNDIGMKRFCKSNIEK